MRFSAGQMVKAPPHECPARRTSNIFAQRIITKRPLDVFELDAIARDIGRLRELQFVVSIRDPRDLVTSRHVSVPSQYFQGADYQFFVSHGVKALINPGIIACYDALSKAEEEGTLPVLRVRYEEIVTAPEEIRHRLRRLTGFPFDRPFADFHTSAVPTALSIQLNGIRPPRPGSAPAWSEAQRLARAHRQVTQFPVLEEIAVRWGYPAFGEVIDRYGLAVPHLETPRGTIVAFHTDDDLYRAEAQRLIRSLDRLRLPYDLTVVPPKDLWVANCAMKPEIIADARRRLRGPLLYVDVDAFVHRDPWPYLAQYHGDIAFHVDRTGQLNSATIFIADTTKAREILDAWVAQQRAHPTQWDQDALREVILRDEAEAEPRWTAQRLPINLAYIFDRAPDYLYGPVLIEQLQASRESVGKWGDDAMWRGDSRRRRIAELERASNGVLQG